MLKRSVCPLLFCVAVANAGVIYSTFGPGDTFLDGHFSHWRSRGELPPLLRQAISAILGYHSNRRSLCFLVPTLYRQHRSGHRGGSWGGIGVLYGLEPYQTSSPAYSDDVNTDSGLSE